MNTRNRNGSSRDVFAAVDLGASSGRVLAGRVGPEVLSVTEAHRFVNRPVRVGGTLYWDVLALYGGVLDGLRAAGRTAGTPTSIGIDAWAVDFGLLDAGGTLLGNPVHYRDERTTGIPERVHARVCAERLYAVTGIQHASFTTIHQLVAAADTPQFGPARRALLIPDLISYWLTGEAGTELTNASTTGLLDPDTRRWSTEIMAELDLDPDLFAPLRAPGAAAGTLTDDVSAETGLPAGVRVTAVASHDTASAVVAVPARDERFAYISSGTWSLVGVELDAPVRGEESRRANFTNELGIDGTVRYLRNVMGLWLLQECMRHWDRLGRPQSLDRLLDDAARVAPLRFLVDAGDPVFLPPGDMPERIAEACRRAGEPVPRTPGETVRCILDSLALAYRRAVRDAQRLSGRAVDVVHVVGGGALNTLLCQATADACALPVVAGPTEAAALGNLLVQARAAGTVPGSLADLRALVRTTQPLRRHEPRPDAGDWARAADRLPKRAESPV
ncbi:rhamnulokinase family protein [Embleya sp. NPDC020630]|uniref:rhamnulokinase family protein n=1 Tax=Embleya sp. NPDC020630 TaxID=3363979 RepID=UPI0037A8C3D4